MISTAIYIYEKPIAITTYKYTYGRTYRVDLKIFFIEAVLSHGFLI